MVRERGSITREVFETRLAEAASCPGSLIEVQTREAVREAVAAGFGIGVVFDSEFGVDRRFHPIEVATPTSRLANMWSASRNGGGLRSCAPSSTSRHLAGRQTPAAKVAAGE